MENNELRMAFIEVLSQDAHPTHIGDLVFQISLFCYEKELIKGEEIKRLFNYQGYKIEKNPGPLFEEKYWAEISSIFWEFVANGTIAVGLKSSNNACNLPRFTLTNFGRKWLKEKKEPLPEDVEGYLKYVKSAIKNIDEIIIQYINEAIKTFNRRYIYASAVMLGAASEKTIYLLAEKIKDFPLNPKIRKNVVDALKYRKLKLLFDSTKDAIDELINQEKIPYDIHEGINNHLSSLFDAIRVQRNDAVHPIAGEINKDKLRLSLLGFPHVCKKVYDILNWLDQNIENQTNPTL